MVLEIQNDGYSRSGMVVDRDKKGLWGASNVAASFLMS